MICLGQIEEIIDEERIVLLYEAHRPSNLPKGMYKNKRRWTQSIEKCNGTRDEESMQKKSCIHYLQLELMNYLQALLGVTATLKASYTWRKLKKN